jgi:hypothetical protein
MTSAPGGLSGMPLRQTATYASARAGASMGYFVAPPGGNGTIMRMVLEGQLCACTMAAKAASMDAMASVIALLFSLPGLF